MKRERISREISCLNPSGSMPGHVSARTMDKVGSLLEALSVCTIVIGSLLLFILLGGCSNLGKGDIDLGLKAKIETTKSSMSSPSGAEQPTQGNEGQ